VLSFSVHKVVTVTVVIFGLSCVPASHASKLDQQREWYVQAGKALDKKDEDGYRQLREKLDEYPLTPYLDYHDFSKDLSKKTPKQVTEFVADYKDLPFNTTVKGNYLNYLAKAERWNDFLTVQPNEPNGQTLKCYYYYAQSQKGNKDLAWQGANALWLTGTSINDECDPLLSDWTKAGKRTNQRILDRMLLAYEQGNSGLLKYLDKQLSGTSQAIGDDVLGLLDKPQNVADFAKRSKVTEFNQQLAETAYKRLARKDVKEAVKQFQRTVDGQHLTPSRTQHIADYTTLRLMSTDKPDLIQWRDNKLKTSSSVNALERRIRLALREADYTEAEKWVNRLPQEAKDTTRWTFWQAYFLARNGKKAEANELYSSILGQRDFYSAAAATVLNKPIVYPTQTVPESIAKQSQQYTTTLVRIQELIALDKSLDANREWYYLLSGKTVEQKRMLAAYAGKHKWHHLAVQATISGQLWDHVTLRFPMAHKWWFDFFSKQRDLPTTTMMALARQESAWNTQAQSPVGARGLMQLMPATAKETAKKLGRNYTGKNSLFDPGVNIRLGSGYLKMMLERYDDNRVYSFAAYNAGPGRVNRWKGQNSGSRDVYTFIEAIPFNETRGYVQNVLMFEIYYSDLMGKKSVLLKKNELTTRY